MTFAPRRRIASVLALVVVIATMGVLASAVPAFAQKSTVTQADCDAGRIKDRSGNTLSRARCEALIGQQVDLADTGFEAWMVGLGGVALLGGAVALGIRRRPVRHLA
jgi:LPXTG-motif cell wall-anchored protein